MDESTSGAVKSAGSSSSSSGPSAGDAREGGEAGEIGEERGKESAKIKVAGEVEGVTRKMREEHWAAGHVPYRNWCEVCVAGCGRDRPHHRVQDDGEGHPVICIDYATLATSGVKDEKESKTVDVEKKNWTVLAMKDKKSKMLFARVLPCKGTEKAYNWKRIARDIEMLGYQKVVIRADGESAVQDLARQVKRNRVEDTIIEKTPKADPRANGAAENAVRQVKERARVTLAALKERLGKEVPSDAHVLPWLIEHGATTYCLYKVGEDGKTPYQRSTARAWRQEAYEFGEQVMFKLPEKTGAKYGLDERWARGTYLGIVRGTYERIVGTKDGVYRCNAVKRKPFEERWDWKAVVEVRGLPWEPKVGEEEIRRPDKTVASEDISVGLGGGVRAPNPAEAVPRDFNINKRIIEKYQKTKGCPGCYGRAPHTSDCRKRIKEAMSNDEVDKEVVERVEAKRNNYLAQAVKESEEKAADPGQDGGGGGDGDVQMEPEAQTSGYETNKRENENAEEPTAKRRCEDTDTSKQNEGDAMMSVGPAMGNVEVMALTSAWEKMGETSTDVAEVYSPPRVTARAQEMGMRPGMAFDITEKDENGVAWDFSRRERREEARRRLRATRPWLLVGSPMCTAFSILQSLNFSRMDPEKVRRLVTEALVHLHFCVQLYRDQMADGRFFLHEHPASATSWRDEKIMKLRADPRVSSVVGHMCSHGMQSEDAEGIGLVYKPTRWMTNGEELAKQVGKRCSNEQKKEFEHDWHRHVHLMGGRASAAQIYPKKLCTAIVVGLKNQLVKIGAMEKGGIGTICCMEPVVEEKDMLETAWDDIHDRELNKEKVLEARREELSYFKKMDVGEIVDIKEAWNVTGQAPISTKWIDTNKGDEKNEDYRSRIVARQFRGNEESMFAATPPLEALKYLLSLAASQRRSNKGWKKLLVIDVRRAYFNATINTPTYVDLPPELAQQGKCWRLKKALYGTRPAAQSWEQEYGNKLMSWGFEIGKSAPCLFRHKSRDLSVVVHGDDFTILGGEADLLWFRGKMQEVYEIKDKGVIGPEEHDVKSVRVLNRVIEWKEDKIIYEADQRHAEIIIDEMGVRNGRTAKTPGEKDKLESENGEDEELSGSEATMYRALAARANYVAADRPDVQFSVKEICRKMAVPVRRDWGKLKRLARYLVGCPRVQIEFAYQVMPKRLEAVVDTDHAGCKRTRKSTNGGALRHGMHTLKTWSSTQSIVALSSGESEYYGLIKGASIVLGALSMTKDLGHTYGLKIYTDSNAAKGMANRSGLNSKTRHMDVHFLWLQGHVRKGTLELEKIDGKKNPADLFTKYLSREEVDRHLERMGCKTLAGRHRDSLCK